MPDARLAGMFHRLSLSIVVAAAVVVGCGPPTLPPEYPAEDGARAPAPARTVDGEVVGVDRRSPGAQLEQSVRVVLRADTTDPVEVELAPGWYLDEQGLFLAASDRIVVEGRAVSREGKTVLEAQRVKKGERTLELRDDAGAPLWPVRQTPK